MEPHRPRTLDRSSHRRPPGILSIFLLSLVSIGEASGQADKPKGALTGRIYLSLNVGAEPFRGIVAIDPNEGTWTRIIDQSSNVARVSLDGRRLAFAKLPPYPGTGETWVRDLSGEAEPTRLLDHSGMIGWSPDGKQVVVSGYATTRDDPRFATWRVNADGSHPERLPIPDTEVVAGWSADGRWFLTYSSRHLPRGEGQPPADPGPGRPIYVMHTDGTDERLVIPVEESTRPPDETTRAWAFWIRFAPDSRAIAYSRRVEVQGKDGRKRKEADVWVVNLDGKDRRRLLGGEGGDAALQACWSPDGRWLAVLRPERQPDESWGYRIEILRPDGQGRRAIPLPAMPNPFLLDWR